jgi:hypothetical protein
MDSFGLSNRFGCSPSRPAALSIRLRDAQGARAVDERQAFNPKTPVRGCVVCVDIAAFMLEMQLAFPQQLKWRRVSRARTFAVPPVQERRSNFCVEHLGLSSPG